MKIPTDSAERQLFYADLVRKCTATRMERFQFYQQLRNYYLFGTIDTAGTSYNKIASTVETLWSFIYAPDSTRFSIHLGTTAPKEDIDKVPILSEEVNDQWRMGRSHLAFNKAGKWALVFGCMIVKGLWIKGRFRSYLVEPHQFGVLREDVCDLEDQEAFVHLYSTTKSQLASDIEALPAERRSQILARAGRSTGNEEEGRLSPGMSRLILSSGISLTQGSSVGGGTVDGGLAGDGQGMTYDYSPRIDDELIDMVELYVWNDDISDYQMVTMAAPDVVVFDRRQPGVKGAPAFVKIAPEGNVYDYFWEDSFVAKLTKLQDWRARRMSEISTLLARQADPPQMFSGFAGVAEEKFRAMRSAGGQISSSMPGAKMENFAPEMPQDLFREVNEIDRMFDDTAGIGHILQGKGEPGVRSKGQADLLARLGSSRPKTRAILVEEAAEDLATLLLRSVQANSDQRFTAPGDGGNAPLTFIASQFTNDYEVKVDAHSSSPIFVEDRKNDAMTLLEAHAIDRETVLEMFDPPGLQVLKKKLAVIEKKEEEQQKAQQQQQALQSVKGGKAA